MIVVLGNTKGGVGKTTLAVQIAITRARTGRRVWLIDADIQSSASSAIAYRPEELPVVACSSFADPKMLRKQLRAQGGNWDDVIIDVGGRDTGALRAALMLADVAIVPFAPESFELWAMHDMAKVIDEVQDERDDGLVVVAVMNKAEPRSGSADNQAAREAVNEMRASFDRVLEPALVKRKAYSLASGSGRGVTEMRPVDARAVGELDSLVKAIYDLEDISETIKKERG